MTNERLGNIQGNCIRGRPHRCNFNDVDNNGER